MSRVCAVERNSPGIAKMDEGTGSGSVRFDMEGGPKRGVGVKRRSGGPVLFNDE